MSQIIFDEQLNWRRNKFKNRRILSSLHRDMEEEKTEAKNRMERS